MSALRKTLVVVPIVSALLASCVPRAAAQLTVFDPANFQENLLSATRGLEQINNQVRQLQNQVLMIQRMDQNLRQLGASIAPDLQRTLADVQAQLRAGDGIALRLQATQAGYEQLYPQQVSAALTSDDVLRSAKLRWDEQYATLKRAALVQGQIADTIDEDRSLLGEAMLRSRAAVGILEATQAGNEVMALSVKQSLALQGALVAHQRAETFAKARDLAIENEARQRIKSFIGTGFAYTAGR
jgi:P-type conjugative transfer protein TrbJ